MDADSWKFAERNIACGDQRRTSLGTERWREHDQCLKSSQGDKSLNYTLNFIIIYLIIHNMENIF